MSNNKSKELRKTDRRTGKDIRETQLEDRGVHRVQPSLFPGSNEWYQVKIMYVQVVVY
jgi:hypothetical protein